MLNFFPEGKTKGHFGALLLCSCLINAPVASADNQSSVKGDPRLLGGETTIFSAHAGAFSKNAANMSSRRKGDFLIGNDFFEDPWVIAPSATDIRDGLGPVFNVSACQSCHFNDGRGHAPANASDDANSLLIRLSRPPVNEEESRYLARPQVANLTDPTYGGQLQDRAIPGVAPEAKITVQYQTRKVRFTDGYEVELRQPIWSLNDWGYGKPHEDTTYSLRVAPPVIGLGLLESIPEETLAALADPEDKDQDGISGRMNRVWDVNRQQQVMGRFGWKAGQPTVRQQTAGAFNGDMGLTTPVFPKDHCTGQQQACMKAINGNGPEGVEVRNDVLDFVAFYASNLAVPARRSMDDKAALRGEKLFNQVGCQQCHAGPFRTAAQGKERIELSEQIIYPYTDLLLHDMGEALADLKLNQRPAPEAEIVEFEATSQEWRTPPLWGIGLSRTVNKQAAFLHDGRARDLLEAVLWHGGEAETAKNKVLEFDAEQREALLAFLNSL